MPRTAFANPRVVGAAGTVPSVAPNGENFSSVPATGMPASLITRTRVSDCSNGYRAVRATVLPQLVLRQEQFHTSEFMIEAIKRGVPATEVPITVVSRLHGHSKKPAVIRYGIGFTNAIMRTWLR